MALLLAVVAAVVVPQVLRPGMDGRASAAPLPAPPAIGTCVILGPRSATPIDCDRPHDGEVFTTWDADDPERPVSRHSLACTDELADLRGDAPWMYGWQPTVFDVGTRLIRAPRDQRLGDRAWAACIIRPDDRSRYEGTAVGLPADAIDRPGAFGECAAGSLYFRLPCTDGHTVERLGTASGTLPRAEGTDLRDNGLPADLDEALSTSCHTLAADLTRTDDPTRGGRLTLAVVRSSMVPAISPSPDLVAWSVDCVVDSGELELTDSVVGLGDSALPTG